MRRRVSASHASGATPSPTPGQMGLQKYPMALLNLQGCGDYKGALARTLECHTLEGRGFLPRISSNFSISVPVASETKPTATSSAQYPTKRFLRVEGHHADRHLVAAPFAATLHNQRGQHAIGIRLRHRATQTRYSRLCKSVLNIVSMACVTSLVYTPAPLLARHFS